MNINKIKSIAIQTTTKKTLRFFPTLSRIINLEQECNEFNEIFFKLKGRINFTKLQHPLKISFKNAFEQNRLKLIELINFISIQLLINIRFKKKIVKITIALLNIFFIFNYFQNLNDSFFPHFM